uniref:Uncharacterized protein n=1 Tax=Attheya septentrionalis TaxID=420275 RepID=A0A7S2UGC5_9STRA|mmetsp:Transcript_24817/g.44937  ORF Transcript_24817/g.44937 Transcript_24817/m.44937 type:complete len:172 (+) Transcript_24817:192-707(+)|eukprot:CAMPEP_0198296102 /NCGR_PEP_ID=MMETSP1449-20131203/30983_1 /TAXON_ID=420275 /ORGANISM="Attheya septentrionalis, Strain CCMP2084" /LENGTH=171 /DNA_ID=CAMNT_0043996611 /DNA_START=153 /DNA_END=668 /DNA_ORIENTATION=-
MKRQQHDIRLGELPDMAERAGMTSAEGELALGGLFSLLKDLLEGEQFNKMSLSLPGIDTLVRNYERQTQTFYPAVHTREGGVGSEEESDEDQHRRKAVTDLITTLVHIRQPGVFLDEQKIMQFIPMFITFVKAKTNVDASMIMYLLLPAEHIVKQNSGIRSESIPSLSKSA